MQHLIPPIVVLSAQIHEQDSVTRWIQNRLMRYYLEATGLSYRKVTGTYKGLTETSFLVFTSTFKDIERLTYIAQDFYQETVLVIDVANRDSYLLDTDTRSVVKRGSYSVGNKKPEGDYTEVTKDRYLEALL